MEEGILAMVSNFLFGWLLNLWRVLTGSRGFCVVDARSLRVTGLIGMRARFDEREMWIQC